MRRKFALGLVLALGVIVAGAVGAITVTTFNIVDLIGVTATPSNPTTGKGRLYYDPVGKALDCLNPDGTACTFGSGGGGAPGGSIGDIQFNNGAGAFTNAVGIHSGATARLSNLTGAMTFTASAGMNFTAGTTMNFSSVGTLTMASSGAAALLEGSSASLVGDSAGVTITATSNFIRLNGVGVVNQINGSASNPAESFSGTAFTGGSGTTTFPLILVGGGAAVTTWSTAGTYIGFDADSGFTGNFFDAHVNGGASVAKLTSTGAFTSTSLSCGVLNTTSCVISGFGSTSGSATITWPAVAGTAGNAIAISNAITVGGSMTATGQVLAGQNQQFVISTRSELGSSADGIWTATNNAGNGFSRFTFGPATSSFPAACPSGTTLLIGLANGNCTTLAPLSASAITGNTLNTGTNCSSAASPAVCAAAAGGSVAIPAGALQTLQVNTTAVTANSQILLTIDEGLGTKLGVTCNTTIATLTQPVVTARSAAASFTIEEPATTSVNPVCVSYMVLN